MDTEYLAKSLWWQAQDSGTCQKPVQSRQCHVSCIQFGLVITFESENQWSTNPTLFSHKKKMHSQPPTSFEKEFTAPDKNIWMNPSNCTAISKKTQEQKPPESIMLQIYPFLSTISPQSLAGFPIFEKLGYLLDCRQAVPGQRASPPPHTSRFLPPPTFVGRHVGPSLFFHPEREEPGS